MSSPANHPRGYSFLRFLTRGFSGASGRIVLVREPVGPAEGANDTGYHGKHVYGVHRCRREFNQAVGGQPVQNEPGHLTRHEPTPTSSPTLKADMSVAERQAVVCPKRYLATNDKANAGCKSDSNAKREQQGERQKVSTEGDESHGTVLHQA